MLVFCRGAKDQLMFLHAWHMQQTTTQRLRSNVSGKDVAGSYLVQEPKVQPSASAFHHEGAHHQPQVLMPCKVVVDPQNDGDVGTRNFLILIPAMHAAIQKPIAICHECRISP